jgi:hypothetical protein
MQFQLDPSSLKLSKGKVSGKVSSSKGEFNLVVSNLDSGSVRVSVTEDTRRWQVHSVARCILS